MALKFAIACVAVMCMVMGASAITCGQVASGIGPCINYVRRGGVAPPPCCNGMRNLLAAAATTPDRQQVCRCLKSLAGTIPGVNYNLAAGLPSVCHVNVPFKISLSTNCDSVK